MTDTLSHANSTTALAPPAQGTYQIDPSHSQIEFTARHLMVTKVRGAFRDFSGRIEVGDSPEHSRVDVVIQAASLDTGDQKRDEHLRNADFLDVEKYPTLEFHSTRVEQADAKLRVEGDLTVRGVTRPVRLDAEFDGAVVDPWGGQRLGFEAKTEIDRDDWGVSWNVPLDSGGLLVSKKVGVELNVEAVKQ